MSQDLAVEVRAALYRAKMTQAELAQRLDIVPAYLSDIINGKKDGPKAQEHIKAIKKILGIRQEV
ncbi:MULTISPECIES: helix-turn-helix transcriptional regulator [unclassified Enterococcus]|uniref:helix-turn-helix domain-containing protein n=1 Tax=unclassified Enterococcus TaxID=2608891 RepID=UPI0015565791|nr:MULTISPECIES: helix-turn-helix transcriptional regulator [unclassified Enterococcus]MBS7577480.1 helix-turn-helix transcriptional regulator [Enterococcus sp. MMGLQ5-2]MBS7585021.1 helix-turn-helix transcriptional regulator [Enterococcus sp. MMGLQ5-1]NPD12877.1 helix-turn-helix transcriptional regulator [Enterococcus sp. MMGLQ5-1]NPD37312.1 helix-turn-helix transcriptional regulator [Enterococcus sp. MMGLQ5-2]